MSELLWSVGAYAAIAVAGALLSIGIARPVPSANGAEPDKVRLPKVRWSGTDVFLSFCIPAAIGLLVPRALLALGAFAFLGPAPDPDGDPQELTRYGQQCNLVSGPLQLIGVLASWATLLFLRHKTRLHDFGLNWSRWAYEFRAGTIAFSLFTPFILSIHWIAGWIFWSRPQPFTSENTGEFAWWEWGLVAFQVCVAAPLIEEVLFRGLLQRWLRRATSPGHLAVALATLVIAGFGMFYSETNTGLDVIDAAPLIFAILLVSMYVYLLCALIGKFNLTDEEIRLWKTLPPKKPLNQGAFKDPEEIVWAFRGRHQAWRNATSALSIFGTAMLWALAHVNAWPAPIALFVMGIGLGVVARTTQSLIGPIVFHSAFNVVAFIALYGTNR